MVATLAQMASAAYYLESQRSFRHPNEYYTAGEEPDGVWWNPCGLFGLADGGRVDCRDFHRLYHGFAPDGGERLTRNAGSEKRSPGLDMTFSADKSVSALWAIADPDLRSEIEGAHNDAARAALAGTVLRYCAWTRLQERDGTRVVAADIMGAMFQHGTSRENDPQLHTHCTIFNAARTHRDGKYRALHQHPVYAWMKAAGAVYRNALAWNLRDRLGIRMEQYGKDGEFTRIAGFASSEGAAGQETAALIGHWSKRRGQIVEAAREIGFDVQGNAPRAAAANKITRAGKSPDNDAEIRHARWRGEAEGFVEREALIVSLLGMVEEITQEQIRALTAVLEDLPYRLTREEAVFRLPDIVERVGNATAGLLNHDAVATSIERVLLSPEVVRLTRPPRSAEGRADMAHTRLYSTRHTLQMEQEVRDMAAGMTADKGHSLSALTVGEKVAGLLKAGYPLSGEQIAAIRSVTSSAGRVAIIEGAAGSGKTTTLRPIADLYREHGNAIIATAVAWRTAVALGNDVDVRPFCVDKLLRLAARDGIEINKDTTIIVDEAGMLSTRQAHHILQLSERHGAKIVFAGDTQQQQPVEAGPGLRLIRDAVGSVRVDRIRRQRADLEDILTHIQRETPETARLLASSMAEERRTRILTYYENMKGRLEFTPWQVAASEALRDGDAASAVAALHLRGRFHIGYDEEKTLTCLVDAWDRYQRTNPGKSSVVLARTRAEARALSHLMRERRFADLPDGENADTDQAHADRAHADRVTVMVSRGTEDERTTSPLEIAHGDRLRIGATHWEKQLFNGTVVTVEDFEVERGEAGTEPSVFISARTEGGREVRFRHDEIRDWYGNIRLDHGYAMTITSAQGLTVDRTFLLADARPSRETIYPAATRHRERLDIYVNRAPLVLDIADRRTDNDREVVVTDTEIRAYLAERWSRSQPKEAALDYMADGVWEDRREGIREDGNRSQGETGEIRTAANDNALTRIARDVRRTAFGWRYAQAVTAFADGRQQVLAAYDELRERTRIEGDTVALSGTFRDTLTRHAVLLKQAETFRARPDVFASLLAERGGIAHKDLDAFEMLHARARRHRRAATMRHVHRIRKDGEQDVQQPKPELRQEELALEGGRSEAPRPVDTVPQDRAGMQSPDLDAPEARIIDTVPPVEAEDYPWTLVAAAQEDVPPPHQYPATDPADSAITTPNTAAPLTDVESSKPNWYSPFEALQRNWTELIERVRQTGEPLFYAKGYADMIQRIQAVAENGQIPAETRAPAIEALENYQRDLLARQHVEDYIAADERHMNAHTSLQRVANRLGVPIVQLSDHLGWRQEADHLVAAAETILGDGDTYGAHLDNMETGHALVEQELSQLRSVIQEDGEYTSKGKKPEPRSEPPDTRETVEQPELGEPTWMPAYEALRRDWNNLVEDVRQARVPLFYAKGYMDIISRVRMIAETPDIPAKSRAPLIQVLENHQHYLSTRKQILQYPGEAQRHMDARASLQDVVAAQEIELTAVSAYPDWRQEAERLTAAGEAILSGKETYGAHLDRLVTARTHMTGALSALREVIGHDDKELAEQEARELQRQQNRHWVGPRFASDDGHALDAARAMSPSASSVQAALSGLGRAIGYLVGGQGYHDRMRTATFAREVLERAEELKRDWNRQVDHAAEEGVHVIYTEGYERLHKKLDRISNNMLLDHGVESEISAVLAQLSKLVSNCNYFDDCREHMADQMDRREVLVAEAAKRGVAVPDLGRYDTWRDVTDFAVGRCEELMDDPGNYGIHLAYIAHAQESLGSTLARVREVLEDDDRHLAASLAGQREGEDIRMREERVARLLDDPEKLRELRQQRAERKTGKAAAEQGPLLEHANLVRPDRRRDHDNR